MNAKDPTIVKVKKCIEQILDSGCRKIIIYPYGDMGVMTKNVLFESYGVKDIIKIDNHLCKYNEDIHPIEYLDQVEMSSYAVILASSNPEIYADLRSSLFKYAVAGQIYEIGAFRQKEGRYTKCGKYSTGCLTDHWLVESVGAFCSFAVGVDVVSNHAIDYISTHPFLYHNSKINEVMPDDYDDYNGFPGHLDGVQPHGIVRKLRRITIGNDVWLGKNVTITNGANIGNGVIAGAGAVITKDVPDYAIVGGVPAKIIRYRYSQEQIDALNRIKWWDWTDDEIRERYDDFYLPIEQFVEKYDSYIL